MKALRYPEKRVRSSDRIRIGVREDVWGIRGMVLGRFQEMGVPTPRHMHCVKGKQDSDKRPERDKETNSTII